MEKKISNSNNFEDESFCCSICFIEYNNDENYSMILTNCGHTICLKCVNDIKKKNNGKVKCPFDQIIQTQNEMKNFSFMSLMNQIKKSKEKQEKQEKLEKQVKQFDSIIISKNDCSHLLVLCNYRNNCFDCVNKRKNSNPKSCYECVSCKKYFLCLSCNKYNFKIECLCNKEMIKDDSKDISCSKCEQHLEGFICYDCYYKLCYACHSSINSLRKNFKQEQRLSISDGFETLTIDEKNFSGKFGDDSTIYSNTVIVAGCTNGRLYIMDFESKKTVKIMEYHKSAITCTSNYNNILATGSFDGSVYLLYFYNVFEALLINILGKDNSDEIVTSIEFLNDKMLIVGYFNSNLRLFSITNLTNDLNLNKIKNEMINTTNNKSNFPNLIEANILKNNKNDASAVRCICKISNTVFSIGIGKVIKIIETDNLFKLEIVNTIADIKSSIISLKLIGMSLIVSSDDGSIRFLDALNNYNLTRKIDAIINTNNYSKSSLNSSLGIYYFDVVEGNNINQVIYIDNTNINIVQRFWKKEEKVTSKDLDFCLSDSVGKITRLLDISIKGRSYLISSSKDQNIRVYNKNYLNNTCKFLNEDEKKKSINSFEITLDSPIETFSFISLNIDTNYCDSFENENSKSLEKSNFYEYKKKDKRECIIF